MLKLNFKPKFKKSERGTAIIESLPVLFMLVMVFNFSLGFFGAIHSGILNSIGSYNYTIETFRFRSDLMYFRPGAPISQNYLLSHNRVHGTTQEGSESTTAESKGSWPATLRSITFNYSTSDSSKNLSRALASLNDGGNEADKRHYGERSTATNIWHATSDYAPEENDSIQTPRIWVKTIYGICLNADCGD
jgi:hypothetical protein